MHYIKNYAKISMCFCEFDGAGISVAYLYWSTVRRVKGKSHEINTRDGKIRCNKKEKLNKKYK